MRVAIPTNTPGGLDGSRSEHFGHCDIFTVIDLGPDNEIENVVTIANGGHQAGGCMAPVSLLNNAGVDVIIVAGLGKRPMQGFNNVGITVYFADFKTAPDVKSVLENMILNKLITMRPEQVCQGSGSCHH